MKKITLIFILLITTIGFSQNNPINFEAGGNGAAWTWTVFENGINPPLEVVTNPDPTGVNTSTTVAKFTALQTGQPFAGVESQHGTDIGTFTLTNANAQVKIWVWKPVISPIGIKFVTGPGGSTGELLVSNTVINQWEELTFDFSSKIGEPTSTDIDQIVVFPDFNARTSDNIVYFDEITFSAVPPSPVSLPFTFEGPLPTFNDFNGSFTQVIANPDASGVNTSANVAENTVPSNAAFAGVNIPVAVDISADKGFTMDVWSPLPNTPVLLKLENSATGVNVERQANTTAASAWEELTFDFGSEGALTFDSVTVFMNFNVVDPNTQTYYWDNLEQFNLGSPPVSLPFTFEGPLPTFNDFNGSFTQVIANPDASGVNTSANVAENTVPSNAAFAGVNIPVAVDISADKGFTMDVWSPLPNTPVLLKLENSATGVNVERQANTTAASAWEELTFDFGSEGALTFDSVTVFMNFNVVDPNTQTYYWDNLEQFNLGSPPVSLPFTFEGPLPTFNDFNGSFTQVIANPDASGVNTSANVAENTVPSNAAFAGVNIPVAVDISADKGFTMDVWSPLPNTPVLLKLENSATGVNVERQANTTAASTWEELTFDFGSEGALTFDSVTVFMNFNVVDPTTQVYYWDNLEQFNVIIPPSNDQCDGAITITCGETISGTTIDATDDTSVAPDCDTTVSAPGVWYVYNDTSGLISDITLSTCDQADYDTKIHVYTGDCGAPPLTCVASNDDGPGCSGFSSELTFQSDGNTTFYILINGFNGAQGNFDLTMTCDLVPPINDNIANSIDIDELGCPFTDTGVALLAATTEGGNPDGCNIDGTNGVWYNITPESDGEIIASILTPSGASFVNFFSAPNENATETDLVLVDWFDNQCAPATSSSIPVEAGQTYYIYVVNTGGVSDVSFDCALLSVGENTISNIQTYPNPVDSKWNVTANDPIQSINIYGILGQKLMSYAPNTNSYEVGMSQLGSGVYLVTITTEKGTETVRILKK